MKNSKTLAKNAISLIDELPDVTLSQEQKAEVEKAIQKAANYSMDRDKWIYRIAISILGVTIIAVVGGGIVLAFDTSLSLPESVVALGATAIGALAGLFARPPDA